MDRFCKSCGAQIAEGLEFCTACGAPAEAQAPQGYAPPPQPGYQAPPQQYAQPAPQQQYGAPAMNYDRNRKYFEQGPIKPIVVLFVVGAILCIIPFIFFIGIILIAIGALLLYLRSSGPKDMEIDQQCISMISNIQNQALQRLGLDADDVKEIAPIVFDGFYYDNIYQGVQYKVGKDNVFRASNYEGVVFFFSANQVYCYTYRFSLINNNETYNSTDEYFYKDIVSASTETISVSYNVNGVSQPRGVEKFKLSTSGGTSISAAMRRSADTERSINGMKSLLRSKKSQ